MSSNAVHANAWPHAPAQEIEPLVRAINELADAREKDLTRARRRAADLAHALKTPLAAIAAQSRRAREAGAADAGRRPGACDRMRQAPRWIASLRAVALLRFAPAPGEVSAACCPVVEAVVGVVERAEFVAQVVFEVERAGRSDGAGRGGRPARADGCADRERRALRAAPRADRWRANAGGRVLSVEDDGPGNRSRADGRRFRAGCAAGRGRRRSRSRPGDCAGPGGSDRRADLPGALGARRSQGVDRLADS